MFDVSQSLLSTEYYLLSWIVYSVANSPTSKYAIIDVKICQKNTRFIFVMPKNMLQGSIQGYSMDLIYLVSTFQWLFYMFYA